MSPLTVFPAELLSPAKKPSALLLSRRSPLTQDRESNTPYYWAPIQTGMKSGKYMKNIHLSKRYRLLWTKPSDTGQKR